MTKFQIIENEQGLEIKLTEITGKEEQLLGELEKCQQGQCSCPTDEYKKLDSMELAQEDEGIQIKLKVKEDQKLEKEEITRCLEHTTKTLKTGE